MENQDIDRIFTKLHDALMKELDEGGERTDEEIRELIDQLLSRSRSDVYVRLSQRAAMRDRLFNSVRRLDILQELIDNDAVTEIMVNGTEGIFIEENGRLRRWEKTFSSREKLENIVRQIAAGCNKSVNESKPILDARLAGGARVNVVMPPTALNGPIVTIRRFPDHPIDMETLIAWNSISREAADFLKDLVVAGYNIFISGGTGSGKTTFLNALSGFIPSDQRIVTIEDTAELKITKSDNLVRLEARGANEEGENEISIRDLIRSSLRMRPDRIVVGEIRGEEAIDMLQAMNTGHDGSLSTGHGNSPRDMLSRIETMILLSDTGLPIDAVRRQVASGIDVLTHLSRIRDKSRRVLEILEIDGFDESSGEIRTHTLFKFREKGEDAQGRIIGELQRMNPLKNMEKLERTGLFERIAKENELRDEEEGRRRTGNEREKGQ